MEHDTLIEILSVNPSRYSEYHGATAVRFQVGIEGNGPFPLICRKVVRNRCLCRKSRNVPE
jgi:hypothetical protein